MAIFTGSGVALITPMNENGDVNYEKMGALVDYLIDNGADALVACGTTGEASTLSHEEHIDVIGYVCDRAKGRVPVIAGTGSNSTSTACYLSKEAVKVGADGLLLVSPYYNKATQKGLIAHFTEIAKATDVPVILYNIPGRTGCTIMPETISCLVKNVDTIVGVKEASGDFDKLARTMYLCNGDIDVYVGNDSQITPALALGAKGVISVLAHLIPRETHDIVAKFMAGDVAESIALQLKYIPLVEALFSEVNPIPVKKAMDLLGWNMGTLRLPLTEMEPAHAEVLASEMRKVGLLNGK